MEQYSTRSLKAKRKRTVTVYLTIKEKKEVIIECGDSSLILYEFYIGKSGIKDYKYTDQKSASALGWEVSKAKRLRLRLEKNGYLKTISYKNGKNKFIVTYIGRENVKETNTPGFLPSAAIISSGISIYDDTANIKQEAQIIEEIPVDNITGENAFSN